MPRLRRRIVSAIGFFALIASTTLIAQEKEKENVPSGQKKGEKELPSAPSGAPKRLPGEGNPSTTLYLVLSTGPDEVGEEIVRNIEKALKFTNAKYSDVPKIKAVSPTFFEEFAGIIDQAAAAADSDTTLGVKRLPSRETIYELTIDPNQLLKKLEVTYKSGKKEEYVPAGPGEKSPLSLIVSGKYAFTPLAGDTPKSYAMTVAEFGKKDVTKSNAWPVSDKYFVVTLRNYVGNKDELFAALRNPNVVASPFDVKRADDLLFAFAGLNSTAAEIETEKLGINQITITAEDLKGRNVRRVWSYFPLDEAGVKTALEEFRKDGLRTVELSKLIRKNSVTAENGNAVINETDAPKWFELPPLPPGERTLQVGFKRAVRVDSLRKLYERYKSMHRLIVWEFDDGSSPPEAILIDSRNATVGKTYVENRELLLFSRKAEELLRKEKK